jgi:Ca-activated chloride channel family protein
MRVLAPLALVSLLIIGWRQASPPPPPQAVGTIAGEIVDLVDAPVVGAKVDLLIGQRLYRSTTTNALGEFRFDNVPHATYDVRVMMAGYDSSTVQVAVSQAEIGKLRITLRSTSANRAGMPAPAPPAQPEPPPTATAAEALAAPDASPQLSYRRGRDGGGYGGGYRGYPRAVIPQPYNSEAYDRIEENRFRRVTDDPLSTFSIDVDSASYANVRRFLSQGTLPPPDAVRTEELINYFRFNYENAPGNAPFSITTELSACPWNPRHKLALIGLQAKRMNEEQTPPRNLVFLLDVSGSMMSDDKLPLVKTAMRMLVDTLRPVDRVAIVVYAGASGLVLPSTPGSRKAEIQRAIAELEAGGSTNGAAGISLAYDVASRAFLEEGINRVILATDGDFNVGVTSQGELIRLIEEKRQRGIFLSVLGVGTGNLKDSTMEKLADKGNGNYSYLDSIYEARRVLIAEAGATLITVAKDVKIQVEFNPRVVGAYKLIGYENRLLQNRDFNDDKKDAGDIGAGHTVTALYEIVPAGDAIEHGSVDPLKYQDAPRPIVAAQSTELMTVKLRYKEPNGTVSRLLTRAVQNRPSELTPNIGFAAAVAEFGMLLRRSEMKGHATWTTAQDLARRFRGDDPDGYRAELARLIDVAAALDRPGPITGASVP